MISNREGEESLFDMRESIASSVERSLGDPTLATAIRNLDDPNDMEAVALINSRFQYHIDQASNGKGTDAVNSEEYYSASVTAQMALGNYLLKLAQKH